MEKKTLVILIISGLIVLAASYYYGFFVKTVEDSPKLQTLEKLQNLLGSKVVQTIFVSAFGDVTDIDDKEITITFMSVEKENLEIPLSPETKVTKYTQLQDVKLGNAVTPQEESISINDIQVNDQVAVEIRIKPDGQFEGTAIRLLSRP